MSRGTSWQGRLMDQHARGLITDEELLQAPTGVSRRARARVHTCHRPVLVGLDGDRCGLPVAVDPFALTPEGEVAALTAGLVTYDLDLGELHPRTHWTIPGRPPAADRPVLAEHRCDAPLPFSWRAPTVTPTAATPTEGPMF